MKKVKIKNFSKTTDYKMKSKKYLIEHNQQKLFNEITT